MTSNGSTRNIKFFDSKKLRPLKVNENPAEDRQCGNDDKVLRQEKIEASVPQKPSGDYYDNFRRVLRYGAEGEVKPEEVYKVMRVIDKAHKDNPEL